MDKIAILSVLASAIFNATIGVFSRLSGLPPEIITFSRLFIGALFVLLLLLKGNRFRLLWQWPTLPVLVNGVLLSGFMFFFVKAMNYTSMANAIMLVYMAPVTASILAHFFLKEHLNPASIGLIFLALFGFTMMMEFRLDLMGNSHDVIGIGYGFLAMLSYSGFMLLNRLIHPHIPVYTRAFWQLTVGAFILLPASLLSFSTVTSGGLPWLLAVGLIPGFLGIFSAVFALSRLPAATFGTLSYFEAVAVLFLGWSLFAESLNFTQITGCLVIIASGILKTMIPYRGTNQLASKMTLASNTFNESRRK